MNKRQWKKHKKKEGLTSWKEIKILNKAKKRLKKLSREADYNFPNIKSWKDGLDRLWRDIVDDYYRHDK